MRVKHISLIHIDSELVIVLFYSIDFLIIIINNNNEPN